VNHLDLFSGIGGFSLGMKQAGIKHGWHGYSDIDKYANNIFRRHFNEAEELGGIESIQLRSMPRLDIVTFGFPCQDLSIAGKRGGLRASRSGLFFEAMRIIRAKRPRYIVFENVKGLLSSNEGYDFIVCLQEIANSGYDGQWQLLNTRWFLPQNRERVFFVGHLRGEPRPKIFPIGENDGESDEVRKETTNTIMSGQQRYDQGSFIIEDRQDRKVQITNVSEREYKRQDICPSLLSRDYKDPKIVIIDKEGNEKNNQDYASCLQGGGNSGGNHSDMDLLQVDKIANGDAGRVFDPNGIACTLKAEGGGWGAKTGLYKIMNSSIRRLTPMECERLQGFPDGWTEGQSDTQRYKQLGNTVSVPVVQSIMEKLNDR
tara:strand:+ start:2988 stop:4106 length:1119 start_codon:yes stop_codon:yes gene_type:complete